MQSTARMLHMVVAWLTVAALVVQVWLAGRGVFDTTGFDAHRSLGYTISILPILLLVLGLAGGMGRRVALMAVSIFLLIILQSVFIYNDFQNPLYFLPGTENATVQLTLFNFKSQFTTQYNLLFANILLVTIPALIMFIFFNRKIVEGMAAGSVKG